MQKMELEWEEKFKNIYPTVAIDKSLGLQQEVKRLPRYVSEWIVAKFCEDEVTEECLNKISLLVSKYLPEKREREKIKHELIESGGYTLIDEFRARTDVDKGVNYLEIPSLDVRNARVKESILKKHEMLF
ncbi:MAG: anti-phage BREX system Lon protease BrxL, partial [Methanosarcinales archaeon]